MPDATDASTGLLTHPDAGARVLVCSVDRGLFGVQAARVEAVYPLASTPVHWLRGSGSRRQAYLVHDGAPALLIDLREALGLADVLGDTQRDACLVLRTGALQLAVAIDHCVGIRTLDLRAHPPLASGLERDDGLPVGHLVELDGRMLVVLDPARLLDGRQREALLSAARRAQAACDRRRRLDAAWEELRLAPTPALLRTWAGLCQRSGRPRAAHAARLVLACLPGGEPPVPLPPEQTLPRLLLHLADGARCGRLTLRAGDIDGTIDLHDGRIAAVTAGAHSGRAALAALLAAPLEQAQFSDRPAGDDAGPLDSTVATLIAALDAPVASRRRRAA